MRTLSLIVAACGVFCAFPTSAEAQQFQGAVNFPDGSGFYSEGIECADVDHDGDLDIFVADGNGFVQGTALQNKLYINKFIETGTPWVIADESAARLGTVFSCAKGVATGDVNGDGWVDVLFANTASGSGAVPSLYINQGAANPGFFTLESATRGFTTPFKAGSAAFGDYDDDGDLDVVINDAFNTTPAAPLHLYINNGAGVFVQNAPALSSPNRSAQMDVQCADMDNDWDVDVLGYTKMSTAGASHFLLRNNGAGTFTDNSNLITPSSGGTYEADLADLDGDNDTDMFFVSLSSFAEGYVRNNTVGLGTFTFTNGPGLGATDDNEIAFIDYDNDGDYDVLVGALGGPERFYRNDGALTFAAVTGSTIIQQITDSTLDCTIADLNNDGKYDILSANGESGTFINRFYKNTGSADTLAPRLVGVNAPATAVSGSNVVVKAKITDQALDDGVNYVTPSGDYVILTVPQAAAMQITAGAFSPASLVVAPGTTITFQNVSGVNQDVTSTSAPYTYGSGSIANGSSYSRTFVRPGTYNFTSASGGFFNGTITVTGATSDALALHMGGQLYRFQMNDTAGGRGVQLAYELRFRDWPGNTRVTDSGLITLTGGSGGNTFCAGDGTGPACPCGNQSLPFAGEGCANSGGIGVRLTASGTASVGADTLVLTALNMPGPGLFFQATGLAASAVAFGDGQLCAAVGIVRMGVVFPSGGSASYPGGTTPAPISAFGATAGTPLHYQCWYRDAVAFCTPDTFNTTNGLTLTWLP